MKNTKTKFTTKYVMAKFWTFNGMHFVGIDGTAYTLSKDVQKNLDNILKEMRQINK